MSTLHAPVHRWTVEEYEELGRTGFLKDHQRVELLNGEIIDLSPIGYRHANAVSLLTHFFVEHARGRFHVSPQNPFHLDPHSQPQPDLVLRDLRCAKLRRLPHPEEIFLVIEVSDTSLRYDRENKGPAYAAHGLCEYWLLNLEENCLEVYRGAQGGAYHEPLVLGPDETAAPLAFPDIVLRVGDFLP